MLENLLCNMTLNVISENTQKYTKTKTNWKTSTNASKKNLNPFIIHTCDSNKIQSAKKKKKSSFVPQD